MPLAPEYYTADMVRAKRKLYQAQGVTTLCLVDAERETVEVWTSDLHFPIAETKQLTWQPEGAVMSHSSSPSQTC